MTDSASADVLHGSDAAAYGREVMTRSLDHWVIEAVAEVRYEDGGQACIVEINEDDDQDNGVYVNFQSWQEGGGQHAIAHLHGKRVRAEITVLDVVSERDRQGEGPTL